MKSILTRSVLSSTLGALCVSALSSSPLLTTDAHAGNNQVTPMSAPSAQWSARPKTDRLIVRFRQTATAQNGMMQTQMVRMRGAAVRSAAQQNVRMVTRTADGADVYQLDDLTDVDDVDAMARELSQNPDVLYAEPDYIMEIKQVPNDPYYGDQWHYYESAGGMNLPEAWDITTGSDDVVVAVIDTGVRPHQDLQNNLLPGYDFISNASAANDGDGRDSNANDPGDATQAGECGNNYPPRDMPSSWHGTHVAGTIAAVSDNGTGVTGVAWNAKILPVRVLGKCGGYTSDISDGMRWAAGLSVQGVPDNPNPAQVLNMSLGGTAPCSRTYQTAIQEVRQQGATVIVAAGNESQDASNATPANCPGVVTVGATDRNGGMAYYSNYGSTVDVSAPGGELYQNSSSGGILSTYNSGQQSPASDSYDYSQGTSMATPHVAGLAALLYSADSTLTPNDVESVLKSTARDFPQTGSDDQCDTNRCGAGIVDAAAAVLAVAPDDGGDDDNGDDDSTRVLENGVAVSGLSGAQGSTVIYEMDVPEGAGNLSFEIYGGQGDADIYVRQGSEPTLNQYDYRPYLNGNNETVNVDSVQAGTYYIMVRAYNAYSGLSLIGEYEEPQVDTHIFSNNNRVDIPDYDTSGVISPIQVNRSGDAGSIAVEVRIRHSYRGDLSVKLYAPNGASATLASPAYDSSDDIVQTWRFNAGSLPAQGEWKLFAADHYSRDVGYIEGWSITFE